MRKNRPTGAPSAPANVPPHVSIHHFITKLLVVLTTALVLTGCKRERGTQDALDQLREAQAAEAAKKAKLGSGRAAKLRYAAYNLVAPKKPRGAVSLGDLSKTPLGKNLKGFQFGTPLRYKRVVVFPIKVAQALKRNQTPMTIDESFKKRKVRVTEEGSGNVPQISLKKRKSPPIFVMTGDMFLGAKQDRISKHDLLLPKRASRHKIPVYCVEQGRWRYGGGSTFRAGNSAGSWRLRRSASKKLSQGTIWRNVGSKTSNLNARTSTQTMAATYRSKLYRKHSPGYLKRLKSFAKKHPEAIGYMGMVKGKLANLELFANNALFQKMWPKMSKAMVLDAIDPKYKASKIDGKTLLPFLQQLAKARYKKTKTPGIGREYLVAHRYLSGTLLMHRKQLYHLSIFPDNNKGLQLKTKSRLRRLQRLYQKRQSYTRAGSGLGNQKGAGISADQRPPRRRHTKARRRRRPMTKHDLYRIHRKSRQRRRRNKRRRWRKRRNKRGRRPYRRLIRKKSSREPRYLKRKRGYFKGVRKPKLKK